MKSAAKSRPFVVPPDGPETLTVLACEEYLPGAEEDPRPDGSVQLRLPLGRWIHGLAGAEVATAPAA